MFLEIIKFQPWQFAWMTNFMDLKRWWTIFNTINSVLISNSFTLFVECNLWYKASKHKRKSGVVAQLQTIFLAFHVNFFVLFCKEWIKLGSVKWPPAYFATAIIEKKIKFKVRKKILKIKNLWVFRMAKMASEKVSHSK